MAVETSGRSAEHARSSQRRNDRSSAGCPGCSGYPTRSSSSSARRGSKLYDVDGREYIDYLLGSGPADPRSRPPGHRRGGLEPGTPCHYFLPSEPTIQLARKIRDAVPCADLVRFVGSGSRP